MTDTDGTILVAVGNVETAERLLDTAIEIATERSYDILLTYVVEVTPQIPLSQGDTLLGEDDEAVLEHAAEIVESAGVDVERRIRYARDTATGIVGAAEEYGTDVVLMGWRGRPPRRNIVLGSYLDVVLRNAPCDVLVKRIRTAQSDEIDAVLVPVAAGPHNQLAAETAGAIARYHDASVTLMHVLPEDATDADRESGETLLDRAESVVGDVSVERKLPESDHVAGRIADETSDHDLTIVGASERSLLRRKLLGTVSEAVGRNAAGTAMIAQRHASKASRENSL